MLTDITSSNCTMCMPCTFMPIRITTGVESLLSTVSSHVCAEVYEIAKQLWK